jgi:lysophospholipase L1-like esterase
VRFTRYVALGDSTTEGLEDPDGRGGYRGWADRFAEHVTTVHPGLAYANLAVRGMFASEIHATQLAPALAMKPDLATVVAGMNDLLRRDFDPLDVAGHVGNMIRELVAIGATTITFTIPDVSSRMRLGRRLSARTTAMNAEIRRLAALHGAIVLDLANYELSSDPRMWAVDRLHGNPAGHARIAGELAHLLGLPGAPPSSRGVSLPPSQPLRAREVIAADVSWIVRFVVPWAWRRVRGRRPTALPKRPTLSPVRPM